MVRNLTEEELCEIAEIRNRLAHLLFEADDSQVTEKDLLYVVLLDLDSVKEVFAEYIYTEDEGDNEEDIENEVPRLESKAEESEPTVG